MPKTYYITTPIYYVNGRPHIGSALSTICCDFLARYHRTLGEEAWFLTGTDEQATKVYEAALKAGVPTQQFVDGLADEFRDTWKRLHIEFSDFIRTTEPRHVKVVQEVFSRLLAKGDIYLDLYEGWYCVADETYFRDSDVEEDRLCPNPECRQPLRRMQEENYFFRLSAYGDRLLAHIEANPTFLEPEFRRNEVVSFIKQGLRDMSVARPGTDWGIEVPGDPSKRIYVWFDALINYLAATGWPSDLGRFEDLWPANVHLVGKEIYVRFHATLWPAMLMALDLSLPLQVYGHGWWVDAEGRKGGKRTGGLPHPVEFAEELAELAGMPYDIAADSLRYLLLREMVFHGDSEFDHASFLRRYNSDLANDLGNLCNRTTSMIVKFFDGVVPTSGSMSPEIAIFASECVADYKIAIGEFRLNAALESAWRLVGRMNRYIQECAPWTQAKVGDTDGLSSTLITCVEALRVIADIIYPAMPKAYCEIRERLGLCGSETPNLKRSLEWEGIPHGTRVPPPMPLFPRILEESIAAFTKNATEKKVSDQIPVTIAESAAPAEVPSHISIDDFLKIQLRTGKVLTAEAVPNATKLLKLSVEVGEETRTILAGIAEMYQPEELIGRLVVVVANLAPRKMRGIESQGMLLAADVDGQAILVQPETEVPTGSRVR